MSAAKCQLKCAIDCKVEASHKLTFPDDSWATACEPCVQHMRQLALHEFKSVIVVEKLEDANVAR